MGKRRFTSLLEMEEFFRKMGAAGGRASAKKLTKAERVAKAKKAAAASAIVRSKKSKERKKKPES